MKLALGSIAAACAVVSSAPFAAAAPYASGVNIVAIAEPGGGTVYRVDFVLNEAADSVVVAIAGESPVVIDGSTKGTKSFVFNGDIASSNVVKPFSITASKNDTVGYRLPTGGTVAASANGLSAVSNAAGFRLISDDASALNKFNSQRGLSVSTGPNAVNFGTAYVSNSLAGTSGGRTTGDGLYALKADGSDATGNGNTAANPGNVFPASQSSPWRNFTAKDGTVYVADFTDTNGNVYALNPGLTTATPVLNGIGGPSTVPNTQNHGSITAVYAEGSVAAGNLKLYTIDEDLTETTAGTGTGTTKLNIWRYDINGSTLPYAAAPVKVNAEPLLINSTDELLRGADGKIYVSQLRSAGTDAGSVFVIDPTTGAKTFDSRTASGGAQDILRNVQGMSVSEDQQWMALMLNNSDVAVVPLVNGIPDLANRVVVDTGTDIISGRDIAFDAAGNIYYVSSGQGLLRVISPGGAQTSTLAYDGTNYTFSSSIAVPEPATLGALAGLGALAIVRRRKA